MSLIDEIEKLRELEQQVNSVDGVEAGNSIWCEYSHVARNLAPAMLEVLGCFRDGDAAILSVARGLLRGCGVMEDSRMMGAMNRAQKAAALMEQEAREG